VNVRNRSTADCADIANKSIRAIRSLDLKMHADRGDPLAAKRPKMRRKKSPGFGAFLCLFGAIPFDRTLVAFGAAVGG